MRVRELKTVKWQRSDFRVGTEAKTNLCLRPWTVGTTLAAPEPVNHVRELPACPTSTVPGALSSTRLRGASTE